MKTTSTKLKFPYEFINYDTYVQKLDKPEPFPTETWDYLRYYNLEDTRLMIEPLDYLIDMFFNYKVDMLQFISISACANAIKYALTYFDFKLDQDYTPKDDYASFVLSQNYWNIEHDSQAKFLQRQIESTTTGAILQITSNRAAQSIQSLCQGIYELKNICNK
ncbi:MAG: hypothetical protein EZS28_033773 [Streblomastix strix]|uniref:Uncharacterized protein n=1 Tax=Streblomastix strix TaxID=222440 RepID=A0A5J4UL16_9EUKA|nr:MAG: hypothetical protein EZS28_033773 [Streblomastix strix]